MVDYTVNDIYQGGHSSMDPNKNYGSVFGGYGVSAGSMGLTTDPRSANVLKEVSDKLSTGVKHIEVAGITPDVFESIPEQHLKEVKRLGELTGVDISLHAPIVEASGITQSGFTEASRKAVEDQMAMVVERGHNLDAKGNIPVTFHSSAGIPGLIKPKGGEVESVPVINTEEGKVSVLPVRKSHFPGEREFDMDREISKRNEELWNREKTVFNERVEKANELVRRYKGDFLLADAERKAGKELNPQEMNAIQFFNMSQGFLKDAYWHLKELCDVAYRKGDEKDRVILNDFYKKVGNQVLEIDKTSDPVKKVVIMQDVFRKSLDIFEDVNVPEVFKPLYRFAEDKSAETFARVALRSYDKFKSKAPIISVENPPVGTAFSTGEELKNLVEKSRDKFVEIAMKEKGMSKHSARRQAEKLLGVTWDVGHINMLRKHGYSEEDVIKESEKVAPLVKNVHLSDNFGFEHTELPMGMGNVPIKEIMEKLGNKGFEAKKIIEAGNWWQHFKTSPVQETLMSMGSPFYATGVGPYWGQAPSFYEGYLGGYGLMLPQKHYEMLGAGFSQLPAELGGQVQSKDGSRMSGTPME